MKLHALTTASTPLRTPFVTSLLLLVVLVISLLFTTPTHALSLGSLDVDLPLGKVTKPLTDTVSPVTESLPLPISLNSTPKTLGAKAVLPSLTGDNGPSVEVKAPLPAIVPELTEPLSNFTSPLLNPVSNTVEPVTQPLSQTLRAVNPRLGAQPNNPIQPFPSVVRSPASNGTLVVSSGSSTSIARVAGAPASNAATQSTASAGISRFFSSALNNTLNALTSGFIGKDINPLPIVISALILLIATVAAGAATYTTRRNEPLASTSHIALKRIALTQDASQAAAFVIAVASFGIVFVILSLTIFS